MSAGDDMVRLARAREAIAVPIPYAAGPLEFWARDVEGTMAELNALRRWADEAALALAAASKISARWAPAGDGLHLGNHDRLIHELDVICPLPMGTRTEDAAA